MEDELEQEGMEEEISPAKAKGKGSPLKMIIIVAGLLVVAVVLVFGFILPTFFADEGEAPEEMEQVEVIPPELTEYGVEYAVDPSITISVHDGRRVRNLVVDVTFETSSAGVAELGKRTGLIQDTIVRSVKHYSSPFERILEQAIQDSIGYMIRNELNMRLPIRNPEEKILSVSINIITQ
ncbi:hypothetical protein ACFL6I_21055 [candidate division KSB1 bacterium]